MTLEQAIYAPSVDNTGHNRGLSLESEMCVWWASLVGLNPSPPESDAVFWLIVSELS